MPAPFAALETRVNNAVFNRLSNVVGVLGGVTVSGIFDQAYDVAGVGLSGMSSGTPAFTLPTSAVPASPVGVVLVVNAVNYVVAEHQPDGSGLSVLLLERTA